MSAAWKTIPESIIVSSFKKCCISNALDGSEDDILWEDDGEDKDDKYYILYNIYIILYNNILYNIINEIINYCILTARTAALSFFQNPAHDRESNPHLIF